jgi:hypothetical protein
MVAFVLALAILQEAPSNRTPSIYRCPTAEAEGPRFEELVRDRHFTEICVDPKPGPLAKAIVAQYAGKVKFINAKALDTKDNLAWRNTTMEFVMGKISPRMWLDRTQNLRPTAHFLTSPQTPDLRSHTQKSILRAVFAELLVLCWPGKPCFTNTDIWKTQYHPNDDVHLSWILAMNDWLGPMLHYRFLHPMLVTAKPKIIRADKAPGLLVFSQSNAKGSLTYYINNGAKPITLPPLDMDRVTIVRNLDVDGPKPVLKECGFVILDQMPE